MNIDEFTIGEVKQLASFLGQGSSPSMYKKYIGKYVIVRSRNEGINAGTVIDADETGVVLKDARRIWYHKPKDKSLSWYEGVAQSGLHKDSKLSGAVLEKVIAEDYSITLCTEIAQQSIESAVSNAQS
ncbi:MAG: hypothetical protein AAF720_00705 [Pseudomonadota bacterium]